MQFNIRKGAAFRYTLIFCITFFQIIQKFCFFTAFFCQNLHSSDFFFSQLIDKFAYFCPFFTGAFTDCFICAFFVTPARFAPLVSR